jgi:hypothetical protein
MGKVNQGRRGPTLAFHTTINKLLVRGAALATTRCR